MKTVEYGVGNQKRIILLHGGGLSWWNHRKAAERLSGDFHVILPVLDGHAGSDRDFAGIGENAEELLRYIDEYCSGSVLLIGGVSLGAQILLETIARRKNVCRYAVIESASVIPSKMLAALMAPMLSVCFGLIRQRWFACLQFQYLRMPPELFGDYYRDTCRITEENMAAFLRESLSYAGSKALCACEAACTVIVGSRELRGMRRSAERLCSILPKSVLEVKRGLYHGEFSASRSCEYADALRKLAL